MVEIAAHTFTSRENAEETLDRSLGRLANAPTVIAKNPPAAGMMIVRYLEAGIVADLLDRPRETVLACFDLALDAGVAAFELAKTKDTTVVTVSGKELRLTGTGPTDDTTPMSWLNVFGLALALRRPAVCDALCSIDLEVLRASPTKFDDYRHDTVAAMQTFWRGGDIEGAVARAEASSQHARAGGTYADVDLTLLRMLAPLDEKQSAAFEAALVAAVDAHRRYWTAKEWQGKAIGYIAIAPLGVAAAARDRGLQFDVKSGYLPEWLLAGKN